MRNSHSQIIFVHSLNKSERVWLPKGRFCLQLVARNLLTTFIATTRRILDHNSKSYNKCWAACVCRREVVEAFTWHDFVLRCVLYVKTRATIAPCRARDFVGSAPSMLNSHL